MKKIFLFALILTSLTSFSQVYKIEYGNKRYMKYHYHCSHDNGFTLKNKLKDGKYIVYSKEDSSIDLIEGFYKDRKKTGEWIIFNPYVKSYEYKTFEKGNLKKEYGIDSLKRVYKNIKHTTDSIIGITFEYFTNNNLRYKDEFRYNKVVKINISKSTYYYVNGQIKEIYNYKNGDAHGNNFLYFENGQIKMQYSNFNGKQVGIWKWWNEEGELVKEKNYGPNLNNQDTE